MVNIGNAKSVVRNLYGSACIGANLFIRATTYPHQVTTNYPPSKERKVRYEKFAIEGKGVFIRDRYTGQLYDLITRKIVE